MLLAFIGLLIFSVCMYLVYKTLNILFSVVENYATKKTTIVYSLWFF